MIDIDDDSHIVRQEDIVRATYYSTDYTASMTSPLPSGTLVKGSAKPVCGSRVHRGIFTVVGLLDTGLYTVVDAEELGYEMSVSTIDALMNPNRRMNS